MDSIQSNTGKAFEPYAKNIGSIFRDTNSFYLVPNYQRPYSWEDEQVEQLWDDLLDSMEGKNASDSGSPAYFLGPIILIRSSDKYFEVIDGQQRLTTLTILFCVVRDLYKKELEAIDKPLAKMIQEMIKDTAYEEPRLKLITQLQYQNKFEDEILEGIKFPEKPLTPKQKKEEKFINAALIFRQKLEELKSERGIEGIRDFLNHLLKNVEMITIICSNQSYAIKLFQVINTRGLDLSPADLIKSHLYSNLSDETARTKFMDTWNEIEILSKQVDENLTDLFTYYEYYLLAQNPKRTLYEELIDKFVNKDPNKIIYAFKKFVDCFCKIYNMQSKIIYSFWYLPNKVYWKTLLTTAMYEGLSNDDFNQLAKELRKMFYAYWIAGYTTKK